MAKGKYHDWIEPDGLTKLEAWARDGLTDEQIAHNAGITTTTLYDWKRRFPAISEALKKGKEVVDIAVENALLKRALGYRYDEVTRENGVVTKVVTKEVQPDTTAQIYWLNNRRPDRWRNRKEHDVQMQTTVVENPYDGLTVDELRKLVQHASD